ncbi:nicotinate phosphoribosyltransferase pncB2 [Anaerotignum neopropionicum]|uniref:Nicotinate phosphoribosyltransferase n=1 Tax=Anaerotignum neopropionicum TaxID=36847 RepID=A0A136WBL9_9FIRM|nr:nicotinate phosphoribosyltransferase [Anaerotignum neopropionicum]KXL51895.1 nicotinate phosphoribosyltransferase pncB2 [Anaerotignum neopropionicum]
MKGRNLALLTDLYELTMMQGYFTTGAYNKKVVFDLFYRKNPSGNGYAIVAGLAQAIEYVQGLHFTKDDINYLVSLNMFTEGFIEFLKDFRFTGEIYAIPEGTVVFPYEPLMRVTAPIIEAQLLETALLNIINHQSLIATKASRVVWAAEGDPVMEFGLRRAQGPDAGTLGARAAVIGGCCGTSNVLTGKLFDVPVKGTHAHSWVMSFPNEITAFREYARQFPDNCLLLVDTYNTLESGVPNAIKVFQEMKAAGKLTGKYGIRLDSGDLAYLSKCAKIMMEEAGFGNAIISASSDLDENLIASLKSQGAKINLWGVGTKLITSDDCPAFGGVYKLAAEEDDNGNFIPKIKLSNNPEKVTNPGIKKVFRIYDKKTKKIKADLIALKEETIDENQGLTICDNNAKWRKMHLSPGTYYVKELLVPIFVDGELVYQSPKTMDIQAFCSKEKNSLWGEHLRLKNPHIVPVDLSEKLSQLKNRLIDEMSFH